MFYFYIRKQYEEQKDRCFEQRQFVCEKRPHDWK